MIFVQFSKSFLCMIQSDLTGRQTDIPNYTFRSPSDRSITSAATRYNIISFLRTLQLVYVGNFFARKFVNRTSHN